MFVVLIAAFWALIVLNINIGSVPISMGKIARILFLRQGEDSQIAIIWKIRQGEPGGFGSPGRTPPEGFPEGMTPPEGMGEPPQGGPGGQPPQGGPGDTPPEGTPGDAPGGQQSRVEGQLGSWSLGGTDADSIGGDDYAYDAALYITAEGIDTEKSARIVSLPATTTKLARPTSSSMTASPATTVSSSWMRITPSPVRQSTC